MLQPPRPRLKEQPETSEAAQQALVDQFVNAGREPAEAREIVSNHARESSSRLKRESANLVEDADSD